jgi:hypothetical protein
VVRDRGTEDHLKSPLEASDREKTKSQNTGIGKRLASRN